ncbi:MAG: sarcosine oxidase subunit alpha family protein, partial [Alphaproteobacteria bacterium]
RLSGHPGDTLASAMLANGIRLAGRSFKYHRPRGIFSAGSEEPSALFEIGTGARRTPNIPATMQELHAGLEATSQNRWPSLSFDLLAVNDLMAPFFGAGFYYKTFMWPKSFWEKVYEPMIRRAAGLGRLSGKPDPDAYDHGFAHCDLLVIGAGPAGLMAALTAARAGARVILADEDFLPGGRLNAERIELDGRPGAEWAAAAVAELEALPNVTLMRRSTVFGAYDGGVYGVLERVSEHLARPPADCPRQTLWHVAARRAVLAAGAIERPIAFPGNDRPGVMLAGAVRSYLNRFAVAAGQKVAVFTNNDDGWRTAADLTAAGITVSALIDTRREAGPGAPRFDGEVMMNRCVAGTRGRLGLRGIRTETGRRIEADCLAVSGGWNPTLHLSAHQGARPDWNEEIAAFVPPETHVPGLAVAGAAAGLFSTHQALASGAQAARAALEALGRPVPAEAELPRAEDAPFAITPFWHVRAPGRAFLDLQNDVTTKDIGIAHAEAFTASEHFKRYTTLGMATDQGKTGNVLGLAVMGELTGRSVPETGTTTFRPPYTPVSIAAFAGRARGAHFQPVRHTPSHQAAGAMGAVWVETGLWLRAQWFTRAGETHWRESCDREARWVREAVGICDVTTLGKIDIQGPDAAAFLDRLYTGTFSTLKPGRVKYGIMLREDGLIFDDGTTARLAEDRFLMTTTTANAVNVMRHMEFCHQCLWPELDVRFVSVTEQWAQFAVAGPKSRALLSEIVAEDISAEAVRFMDWIPVTVAGVTGRLFRISFSGELAYEIAVPTRYGNALFAMLVGKAEAMGGGAYGTEALNVLRIEKGHLTGAELNGRVSGFDAGFQKMMSTKKDYIGKVLAQRPGLNGPERAQFVGLKPAGEAKRLLAGARLINRGEAPVAANDQGYLSSVCYSPSLGHMIGLGFVVNGRERMGEVLRMVDLVRDIECDVEICAPHFVDPKGERLHG